MFFVNFLCNKTGSQALIKYLLSIELFYLRFGQGIVAISNIGRSKHKIVLYYYYFEYGPHRLVYTNIGRSLLIMTAFRVLAVTYTVYKAERL